MNHRYKPLKFRPAFGVAAAALSAVTLAVAVVLPVGLGGTCGEDAALASAPAPIEVAIDPAQVDVVAAPERVVVLGPVSVVARREALRT